MLENVEQRGRIVLGGAYVVLVKDLGKTRFRT